ncbi:MAG TPA: hypothetical protein PLL54_05620 [Dermatophilaceae bacterium]|jgi:hypothetical protein|nr:hypothetical protein [Dermatophilaceae bacterium]
MVETVRIDFDPVFRAIDQTRRALESQISEVSVDVGVVRQDVKSTNDELRQLRREFEAFVEQAERTALVQQSEVKIVNLKAELDRQFGHYAAVRRTSTGMLQAFDIGNVSNKTVQSISEELMIQTPRYWLAPALVTLAAWSRDNHEIAEKSVAEAFARDKNKTSLFFALVLRRQGRMDASVRWLRHYLTSLDPLALTREFAVILEATSYDAFGPAGQRLLSARMSEWVKELRTRDDIVESQINLWRKEIQTQGQALAPTLFPVLAAVSPQWGQVKGTLEKASALPPVLEKYTAVRNHDGSIPRVLEDLLDDILDQLVSEYDDEELPLRREVRFHEAIIEEGGHRDRAQAKADLVLRALERTDDVVTLQTTAAITPELMGVSTQTQRIAVGVGQQDFRTAVGRHTTDYRSGHLTVVDIALGPDHSSYASTYKFPGWQTTTQVDEETALTQLRQVWQNTFDAAAESLRFKDSWYVKPALIAAAAALFAGLIGKILVGLLVLAVGAAAVYFLGEQQKKKCQAAVDALEKAKGPAIDKSIEIYRDATAQFVEAELLYEELDATEADLLQLIDLWPTATPADKESVA